LFLALIIVSPAAQAKKPPVKIPASAHHASQARAPSSAADQLTADLGADVKSMGGLSIEVPDDLHVKLGQKSIIKVTVTSTDLDARSITVQATAEKGLTRSGSQQPKILTAMKRRKPRTIAFQFQANEAGQFLINVEVDRNTSKGIDSRTASFLVTVQE
jgi:hypothetical protein